MRLTRRQSMGLAAMAAGGLLAPRPARADTGSDRKFLFLFCPGGWDPAWALAPVFGSVAAMPTGAVPGHANGIDYVDNPASPSVGTFFERFGADTCLIHGIEARSVAHDVCLRLILTGASNPGHDDWPLWLASLSDTRLTMPYVNLSGPTYAGPSASSLVRAGRSGQLAALLDGSAVDEADLPISRPSAATSELIEAALRGRLALWTTGAGRGREATLAIAAEESEARLGELLVLAEDLDLAGGTTLSERADIALACLERGLSRVGMVEHVGHMGLSWDTHGVQTNQSGNFEELFSELPLILESLAGRTSITGAPLADEVTVVVMSEMGRYPTLNSRQGKEHWTYTSCLLIGSGVRGGQSIGGYNLETYRGEGVSLETGEPGDTPLEPTHLGATLLTLGGHDAMELLGVPPLAAALVDA